MDTENINIKIGQLNVGRRYAGTAEIGLLMKKMDLSILAAQEPYCNDGRVMEVANVQKHVKQGLSTPKICVSGACGDMLQVMHHCDEVVTVTRIALCDGEWLFVVCVYCELEQRIENCLKGWNKVLATLRGKMVLIMSDFNAKSRVWFDDLTDKNGLAVEVFVLKHTLHVLNERTKLAMGCSF